jgi:hypothetical protein
VGMRSALGCFEERQDGVWVCVHATTVKGPHCSIAVKPGQSFAPGTVFAGYDDFAGYLASVSTPGEAIGRHEW